MTLTTIRGHGPDAQSEIASSDLGVCMFHNDIAVGHSSQQLQYSLENAGMAAFQASSTGLEDKKIPADCLLCTFAVLPAFNALQMHALVPCQSLSCPI